MSRWLVLLDLARVQREYPFVMSLMISSPNRYSIQLIERFYDPLAGDVYVSNSIQFPTNVSNHSFLAGR